MGKSAQRKGRAAELELVRILNDHGIPVCGIRNVLDDAEGYPAADVAPVKHGYWNKSGECSVCGAYIPTDSCKDAIFADDLQYCYSCGAKMDGKEQDE